MAARTMRINSARGLLREFGIVFPSGAGRLPDHVQSLIEDAEAPVPMLLRELLHQLILEIGELESRVKTVEKHLAALASQTPVVERLRTIPGVGLLTATALVGFVGDVERFPSGRHFACYLGLTPRERSSGGRRRLGRISKQGDVYLRMLLIHGARAVLQGAQPQSNPDRFRCWALDLNLVAVTTRQQPPWPTRWPASPGPFGSSENLSSPTLRLWPDRLGALTIFPAAARLRFELWTNRSDRRGGKPITNVAASGPVQRLAPRARISSWPGALCSN
jgi:Transposase IS116/IS110/IS902 family